MEEEGKSISTRSEVIVSWNVRVVGDLGARGYESKDC